MGSVIMQERLSCPFCGYSELRKDGFAYVPRNGQPSKVQRWQCKSKKCRRTTVNPSREMAGEKV